MSTNPPAAVRGTGAAGDTIARNLSDSDDHGSDASDAGGLDLSAAKRILGTEFGSKLHRRHKAVTPRTAFKRHRRSINRITLNLILSLVSEQSWVLLCVCLSQCALVVQDALQIEVV